MNSKASSPLMQMLLHLRCFPGSMKAHTGHHKINILLLTPQIHPDETRPKAPLNNMHPNLAWALWGGDQDTLTNCSWHTQVPTQTKKQAGTPGALPIRQQTHARTTRYLICSNVQLAILNRHSCLTSSGFHVPRGLRMCRTKWKSARSLDSKFSANNSSRSH